MDFNASLHAIGLLYGDYGWVLNTGLLLLARVLAFTAFAPVLSRKDIPFNIKTAFALVITIMLIWLVPQANIPSQTPTIGQFFYLLLLNAFIGALVALIAGMIHRVIAAAGSMMNNQIGLSSAMIFDPSSRAQVMLLDQFFGLFATVIFIYIGGLYWLLDALKRTIDIFPVYGYAHPFTDVIDLSYLSTVAGNSIVIAVQLVAPVIVVTLAVDIMLGVVNRTAQQMPVFQLSFALKPAIGMGVLLVTLPIFIEAVIHYFRDFSKIFG